MKNREPIMALGVESTAARVSQFLASVTEEEDCRRIEARQTMREGAEAARKLLRVRPDLISQGDNPEFDWDSLSEREKIAWEIWHGEYENCYEAAKATGVSPQALHRYVQKIEQQTGEKYSTRTVKAGKKAVEGSFD